MAGVYVFQAAVPRVEDPEEQGDEHPFGHVLGHMTVHMRHGLIRAAAEQRRRSECRLKVGHDHGRRQPLPRDIADHELVAKLWKDGFDLVVNFAAETHVDRSILWADDFIKTDVLGTFTLVEAARQFGVKRFVQISTDEVYGSLEPPHEADENYPLNPSSPYSASKASGDLLARSYFVTFKLPVAGPWGFLDGLAA